MGLQRVQTLIDWLQQEIIPNAIDEEHTTIFRAIVSELEEHRLSLMKRVPNAVHMVPNLCIQDGHAIAVSKEGRVLFVGRASAVLDRIFDEGTTINLSPGNYQLINRKLAETKKGLPAESV